MDWAFTLTILPLLCFVILLAGELLHEFIKKLPFIGSLRANVERSTASQKLSLTRIGYLRGETIIFLGVVISIVIAVDSVLGEGGDAVAAFFERHFN